MSNDLGELSDEDRSERIRHVSYACFSYRTSRVKVDRKCCLLLLEMPQLQRTFIHATDIFKYLSRP